MTSYERSIVTIGLSRTVSEINGNIRRKSPIFRRPGVFTAPDEGVSLGIWYQPRGLKSLNDDGTRWLKKF